MRLDELVNRWNAELDERTKEFAELAAEVKAWDGVLIANGDKIARLLGQVGEIEPAQSQIEHALDYIETQQQQLASTLDTYERQVDDLLGDAPGSSATSLRTEAGGADAERERAYALAETLNRQLDDLGKNLGGLVSEVNSLSHSSGLVESSDDDADPVAQIAAILGAHLGSLEWIAGATDRLAAQIDEIDGKIKPLGAAGLRRGTPKRSFR